MKERRRYLSEVLGRFRLTVALLFVVLTGSVLALPASTATAASSAEKCASTVVLGLQGTTETHFGSTGTLAKKIRIEFKSKVRTQSLTPKEYPASKLWPVYAISVAHGERSLRSIVENLASRCTKSSTVLIGYSQGAQVIGNVIDTRGVQLSATAKRNVKAIVLFGDPTYSKGESYNRGTATRSGRSGTFNRGAGKFKDFAPRIRSYCNLYDTFCQSYPIGRGTDAQHGAYSTYNNDAYKFVRGRY